jgi:transposase
VPHTQGGFELYYPISIGLDVHLNSISASALDADTGELTQRWFEGADTEGLTKWILSFGQKAWAVYESGFCGFALKRELDAAGIPCLIAAVSKLARPSGERVKTDKRDAAFLARQLAAHNIVPVHVPGIEQEGMRDLSRALDTVREALVSAKLRVVQTHHRYGLRYGGDGPKRAWAVGWLSWAKSLKMPSAGAQHAYDFHMAEALRLIDEKKRIESLIHKWCGEPSLKGKADAMTAIKGISKTGAFCLMSEIGEFSRFAKGSGFSSFLGLVPSENSSGGSVRRGSITHAGNEHVRKALIESAWCYSRVKTPYKQTPDGVTPAIAAIAYKANMRLFEKRRHLAGTKKPCVANAAIARELACWIWAIATAFEREAPMSE